MMKIIGITGGVGSGKSEVIRFLEKRGTYLVTCYAPEALIDGTGRALPENSSVEVRPGTVFENAVDQSPLFQTG